MQGYFCLMSSTLQGSFFSDLTDLGVNGFLLLGQKQHKKTRHQNIDWNQNILKFPICKQLRFCRRNVFADNFCKDQYFYL